MFPVYKSLVKLQLHPVFNILGSLTDLESQRSALYLLTGVRVWNDAAADKLGLWSSEFVTSPRCCAIYLSGCFSTGGAPDNIQHCLVYVKDGVRIVDLLIVRKALVKTHVEYVLGGRAHTLAENFYFAFGECLES